MASTTADRSVSASSVCSTRVRGRTGAGRPARLHGTGQASASAAGRSPVSASGLRPPTRPLWKGISVDAPLRT